MTIMRRLSVLERAAIEREAWKARDLWHRVVFDEPLDEAGRKALEDEIASWPEEERRADEPLWLGIVAIYRALTHPPYSHPRDVADPDWAAVIAVCRRLAPRYELPANAPTTTVLRAIQHHALYFLTGQYEKDQHDDQTATATAGSRPHATH